MAAAGLIRSSGKRLINNIVSTKNTALFLCDMQTKFQKRVKYFDEIVQVSNKLLKTAIALQIPTIVTEQYPQGLGRTVPELGIEEFGLKPISKTQFCMLTPDVEGELKSHSQVNSVILCGIESHVCIQQTALELLERNYDVHLVVDASSSQSLVNRKYAFKLMRDCGVHLTTSESVIFALLKDASHPKFKELQKLVQDPAPDTGL